MADKMVIGYGNRTRSDDAVGVIVAEKLWGEFNAGEVECMAVHQLTPELVEDVKNVNLVLFIDASAEPDAPPVSCRRISPTPPSGIFIHHLTPAGLLALTRALYDYCPTGLLLAIRATSFAHGEDLSQPVESLVPKAVERAREILTDDGMDDILPL